MLAWRTRLQTRAGAGEAALASATEAIEAAREALTLAEETGHRHFLGRVLTALARSALPVDRSAAADAARSGLERARVGGFRVLEGQALAVLAAIEHADGDIAAAATLAGRRRWRAELTRLAGGSQP
jgi:hypothetical protein